MVTAVNHEHGLKGSASLYGREVIGEEIIECCKILTVMKRVDRELLFLFSSYTTTRSHQKKNQIADQIQAKRVTSSHGVQLNSGSHCHRMLWIAIGLQGSKSN